MNVEQAKANRGDMERKLSELNTERDQLRADLISLTEQIDAEEGKPLWFVHIFKDIPEEFLCGVEPSAMIKTFLDHNGEMEESPSGYMVSAPNCRPMDMVGKMAAMYVIGYCDGACSI